MCDRRKSPRVAGELARRASVRRTRRASSPATRAILITILISLAFVAHADEPLIAQKLALLSNKNANATVYYEKNVPGDAGAALKAYDALLTELANRTTVGNRADAMLDQIDSLVGFTPTKDERATQRQVLDAVAKMTNFMPKTLCIVRQSTIKDLLERGETLPNFTFDRATRSVSMNFQFDSKHPQATNYFIMPLVPDTTMEQCVEQLHQMLVAAIPSTAIALHEVTEMAIVQRLHPSTPYFRWFSDGFANTIAAKVVHDQISPEAADDFLKMYDTAKLGDIEKRVNLMWWMGKDAEIDTPLPFEKDLENARYCFATFEAKRLADQYGYDKIAAIITKASPAKVNDPRGLFDAVKEATGEDLRERFKRYQSFATDKEGIELYSNQFNTLKIRGDLQGALSALLRMREIRGPNSLEDYRAAASMFISLKQQPAAEQMYQKLFDLLKRRGQNDQRLAALESYCDYSLEAKTPENAADAAIEVLQAAPKSLPALSVRMVTLQQETRTSEAVELANQILAIEQPDNSAYRRLAEQVRAKNKSTAPPGGSSDRFHL